MKKNGEYVGVDEKFIPENEKYVDESLLGDKEKAKKVAKRFAKRFAKFAKRFGIGYLCFFFLIFAFVIGMMIFGITRFVSMRKDFDNFSSNGTVSVDYMFEQYQGTNWGSTVMGVLDKVVTNNKTGKKTVTVVYKDKTATTEEEIVALKKELVSNIDYELSIGYDNSGKVNQITIKDVKKVQTASSFNFDIKDIQGQKYGADWRLDKYVIASNKTNNEHIITVVYKETTATTEDEILALEKLLDKGTKYYYSLDYDSEGFINKITIKDI